MHGRVFLIDVKHVQHIRPLNEEKEDKKRLTKELLKEWQRTHYQEYCDFSDMMHDRNGAGFDKVYAEAVAMVPKFEKALFLYLKNDDLKESTIWRPF